MATKSKSGQTVYPKIGVWRPADGDHIHLSIEGQGLTSVTDNPDSERFHRTLYAQLAEVLREHGAWPTKAKDAKARRPRGAPPKWIAKRSPHSCGLARCSKGM